MNSEDPSLWNHLAEGAAAVVAGLVGIIWKDYRKRIQDVEDKLGSKTDKSESDRQRDHIEKLFDANAQIIKDMNGGFERITNLIHSAELRIMTELGKKADR